MKYDEKTGKKMPESRLDEIQISLDQLYDRQKKCDGLLDRGIENSVLLKDINVSLGLIVDILGVLVNRLIDNSSTQKDPKEKMQ